LLIHDLYFVFTFLNSCENDGKLSTLAIKMGRDLAILSTRTMILASLNSSSNPSKALVIDTDLLDRYLFIFGYLQGIDISRRFLFLLLTSFHEASMFVFCVLYVICFKVTVTFLFTRSRSILDSFRKRSFFSVSIAFRQNLFYHRNFYELSC